ncbi:MAG TPA: YceI family protein [Thermoanaerobaculia bacterium]|nr:YceI family protein [Thermoanaerobaculia bacterium]
MSRLHSRLQSVLFAIALSLPAGASAELLTLELDPAKTTVQFGFGATLQHVTGDLRFQQGSIRFDTDTGAASGQLVVDATSAKTGVGRRDRKMHQKILESARFPKVIFAVDRIDGKLNRNGRNELQLHGMLELHGVRRPASMPVVATVRGDRVTASGYLVVPYLEWGMRDPSYLLLRVQKEVRVTVSTAGHLTSAAAPGTPSPGRSAARGLAIRTSRRRAGR